MGNLLSHRCSKAQVRFKEVYAKPDWMDNDIWEQIGTEWDKNPNLFKQQLQAHAQQTSGQTRHLGRGGKAAMKWDFVSIVDKIL